MSLPPIEFDPLEVEGTPNTSGAAGGEDHLTSVLLAVAAMAMVAVVWWIVTSDDGSSSQVDPVSDTADQTDSRVGPGYDGVVEIAGSIPTPLLAAELFTAQPSRSTARTLFETLGGFDGLEVATADGAFDFVRFDPLNSDRLTASNRLSYGAATNNDVNELWTISSLGLDQQLWAPEFDHDFVHFNADGSATAWVHGGGDGFAPRVAQLMSNDFVTLTSTAPMYASRFAADNGFVFALTGNGDYYTNKVGYVDLVADDGTERTILSPASTFEWIDNPATGLLVAYPKFDTDRTRVWSTATLESIEGHPLSNRSYRRASMSADGSTAIGVTFEGEAEVLDLSTGEVVRRFGDLDVRGVDQPLTLSRDGTVAITIERSGRVTMWWVPGGAPIAAVSGDSAQPRWLSEEYAARSTSVVAAQATRVALRIGARPEIGVSWSIVDTDLNSWVQQACAMAGRPLTPIERSALGLDLARRACF